MSSDFFHEIKCTKHFANETILSKKICLNSKFISGLIRAVDQDCKVTERMVKKSVDTNRDKHHGICKELVRLPWQVNDNLGLIWEKYILRRSIC